MEVEIPCSFSKIWLSYTDGYCTVYSSRLLVSLCKGDGDQRVIYCRAVKGAWWISLSWVVGIRCVQYITSSGRTLRLGYMRDSLSGKRQLHRPHCTGEGPSRYAYSMIVMTIHVQNSVHYVQLYILKCTSTLNGYPQRICINTEVTATSFVFAKSVFCLR